MLKKLEINGNRSRKTLRGYSRCNEGRMPCMRGGGAQIASAKTSKYGVNAKEMIYPTLDAMKRRV